MKAFPRDVEVQSMDTRHVGIENELQVNLTDELVEKLSKRGLLHPHISYDGGGREFRTHPISCKALKQKRGPKYLREYFDTLKPHTRVCNSGGTHIHISILNKDRECMEAHATALGIAFFTQFQKISGRHTHWAPRYPADTLQEVKDRLNRYRFYPHQRAYSRCGSMLNPTSHQTLEFRGPKGSNDANEIFAWIEFLENVVNRANRKSIEGVKFADLLKGPHLEAYVASLTGWRTLTDSDLNATLNPSALR